MSASANRDRVCLIVVLAMLGLAAADAVFAWPSEYHLFSAFTAIGCITVLVVLVLRGRNARADRPLMLRFALFSVVLVLMFAVYLLNPTHRWQEGIGLLPVANLAFLPGSAAPEATWVTFRFMLAVLVVLGCSLGISRPGLRLFQMIMLLGAAAMAGLVLWQRLTPRPFPVYEFTGIFVSENQFAAYANLAFPFALAVGARLQYRAFQAGRVSSPAILFYAVAGLLTASIYLSRSRAGLLINALLLMAFIGWQWVLRRHHPFLAPPLPSFIKVLVAAIALSVLVGGVYAGAKEWKHVHQFGRELAYRGEIVSDTLTMWTDRPWWGIGPGAYAMVFPYYQSESGRGRFIRHAHCEPAEFLAEYGILGTSILIMAGLYLFRAGGRSEEDEGEIPSIAELEIPALVLAIGGCLLHGLVDFPLRQPLIGLMVVACAGMITSQKSKVVRQ